jgi:hypothetical protein
MTSSTLIGRRAFAAILVAGWLVAPAAMAQSPDGPSSVKDRARANVYVPPSPETATEQGQRWLDAQTTPNLQSPDQRDAASRVGETANVYIPPVTDGMSVPQGQAPTQTIARTADDDPSPWAVIGLALGGALLLGGASLALVHRARLARRTVA